MLAQATLASGSVVGRGARWKSNRGLVCGRRIVLSSLASLGMKLTSFQFNSVKTTPQKTRFRGVKYARIWDTD